MAFTRNLRNPHAIAITVEAVSGSTAWRYARRINSRPAKALTRTVAWIAANENWSAIDRPTRNVWPGLMKYLASAEPGSTRKFAALLVSRAARRFSAASSSARTTVVPMARMAGLSRRALQIAAAAGFGNFVALGMNLVLLDIFFMNGLKGAEPDVQGDGCDFDTALPEPLENRGRKMQPGRRRGHSSRAICENGLVALAVRRFVFARNVWRQRNMAKAFDGLVDVSLCCQADPSQAVFAAA